MKLGLSGRDTQKLADALQEAFTYEELRVMLRVETGVRIEDLTTRHMEENIAFFSVVSRAEMQAWSDKLLLGAAAWRPDDPALAAFFARYGLSSAGADRLTVQAELRGGDASATGALQRILGQGGAWTDLEVFLGRLGQLEGQVCRVESNGEALGSGFLVGPDLVLTNWHVMAAFRQAPGAVGCRFDYRKIGATGAERPGVSFALRAADWLVAWSPPAEGDEKPDGKPPTADELDYALLRLNDAAGETTKGEPVSRAVEQRGYVKLRAAAPVPATAAPVFLLQHPLGSPLKLAVGSALDQVNPFRIRYNADSEAGSSGSPLFDGRLDLVGLHHATDAVVDPRHRPRYNQGVPVARIVGDLRDRVGLAPIWE